MSNSKPKYCAHCDAEDSEWTLSGIDGNPECSRCHSALYDDKEDYIRQMKSLLSKQEGMSAEEVEEFLIEHGNPGKGQALGILAGDSV